MPVTGVVTGIFQRIRELLRLVRSVLVGGVRINISAPLVGRATRTTHIGSAVTFGVSTSPVSGARC